MASTMEQRLHIIAKALKDEAFRKELINDPKGVIARETGAQIPDSLEIKVVEEAENIAYFVLPQIPSGLLSDDALDAVAGGGGDPTFRRGGIGQSGIPGPGIDVDRIQAAGTNSAITDSAFCYSAYGGGCTVFGCDDFRG